MFTVRMCVFDGDELICKGQPQEMERLSEGRNVLKAGQVLKVSDKMILSVTQDEKGLNLLFITETGELVNTIDFPKAKELEVEKMMSILSVYNNGRYVGINTKGKLLGEYVLIYYREEEGDIVGQTSNGPTALAKIYERP